MGLLSAHVLHVSLATSTGQLRWESAFENRNCFSGYLSGDKKYSVICYYGNKT